MNYQVGKKQSQNQGVVNSFSKINQPNNNKNLTYNNNFKGSTSGLTPS